MLQDRQLQNGRVEKVFLILSNHFKKRLLERTLVTAIPKKINKNEIGKVNILLPEDKIEQEKIGQFFSNLDKEIEINQQKYEKLCDVKKALLSKLFPTKEDE